MKILVTGSSGFVGKHLTRALNEMGHSVIEADFADGYDVSSFNSISTIEAFDICYHLAACTYVPDSYTNPHTFYNVNCMGTLNVLELCRKYHAKMIYVSSYVYGAPDYLPIDEKHPVKAFNPYAQTKVIAEKMCEGYSRDFGVPVAIVRPFNLYGPNQSPLFLIPKMIRGALDGRITIMDDRPRRDFIFISDVIDFYVRLLDFNSEDLTIFNLGFGKSYSPLDIFDLLEKEMLKKYCRKIALKVERNYRKNEILDTVCNIEKAKNLLNWSPKVDLEDGIRKCFGEIEG